MKRFITILILICITLLPSCSFALDVLVNQAAYETNAPKVFRVQRATDYAGDGTFSVRRVSDSATVYSGTLTRKGALWNKFYWEGDFSSFKTSGDYNISATVDTETGTSYNFNISPGSLFNKTGKLTYQYFTAQRCGAAVSLQYIDRNGNLVTWSHNACHTDDGYINPSGPQMDGTGGWHDAGDYGKYGHGFAGNPVFDLIWLYESNRSYYDAFDANSNGIADIIDEVLWQARWLVKIVRADGHVLGTFGQRRSGESWRRPEADTDRITGNSDDRWIYPLDENTPQEIVVCCALARMHRLLASKGLPTENFAEKALSIWNHRVALAISEGGHNNLGSGMHHIFASLDLYAIYGLQDCWDRALRMVDEMAGNAINNPAIYDIHAEPAGYELGALAWFARTYPTQPLAAKARTAAQTLMNHYLYLADNPIGLIRRLENGQLQYLPAYPSLGNNRLYGVVAWGAIEAYKTIGDPAYLRFAMDQYNWILGANYHNVCMMEAAGDRHVDKYHSRYDTFVANGIEPGVVTNGMIRDASGIPWVYFGTGSASVETNEGWLPNSSAYAMALAATTVFRDQQRVTISNSAFDSSLQGWAGLGWRTGGASDGTAAWNAGTGNPGGAAHFAGYGITDDSSACLREGGEIRKTISTVGYESIKISYDLKVNSLGANFTGSGSGCSVDHGLIDEQLTVYYSVDGGANWTEADWVKRADLLTSYQSYGTRTIDLSFTHEVSNRSNFMLRFRWQFNTESDAADIDNIVVTGVASGTADTSAPSAVTNLAAAAGDQQVNLSWTNPSDSDFAGTKILFKTTGYPTSATDGTLVCDRPNTPGSSDSFLHSSLTNGVTHYYAAFAYDGVPNFSAAATASATPNDVTPPGPVPNFSAVNSSMQINLNWTNPTASDYAGTRVVFKTTGYPTGPTDGTLLYNGTATSCIHTGLSAGTTYYYSAYAYDEVPNYSTASNRSVVRSGSFCYADSFSYPGANLNGNIGWSGSAASSIALDNSTVKINGGAGASEAVRLVSCSDSGSGNLWATVKAKAGFGTATLWSLYIDDANGNNLARWYGSGTTAKGRIGGTSDITPTHNLTSNWDELSVRISPSTNTSEFFVNGISIGILSHASQGSGDTIGRLRFERIDNINAAGDYVYLDDLTVGPPDSVAPANPTAFTAIRGNTINTLTWINTSASDLTGVMIRYKTGSYPTGPTDGTLVCNRTSTPGSSDSFTHTGLTNGITYYYKAYSYDYIPNYSSGASANATPAYFDPAQAKILANNTALTLTAGIVSAEFPDYLYVQCEDKPVGIRVNKTAHGLNEGDSIGVKGTVLTDPINSEKYISATWAKSNGTGSIFPIAMSNRAVGGVNWNYNDSTGAGQRGIAGGLGANNMGVLVRIWGKVTQRDTANLTYFYIDDGSYIADGTLTGSEDNIGVRISANPTSYARNSFVIVTGVVTCFKDTSGNIRRMILPKQNGIQPIGL